MENIVNLQTLCAPFFHSQRTAEKKKQQKNKNNFPLHTELNLKMANLRTPLKQHPVQVLVKVSMEKEYC